MKKNGLIIGGGIVGSAVAYELSRRGVGDLRVLDADLQGEWSSSERNAGGVRHLWVQRVNMDLARCSIGLFAQNAPAIGFQKTGYLWLFSHDQREDGEAALARARRNNLEYEELSVADIQSRYPFLDKTDGIAFGLFGPRDGILNPNALKQFFRTEAMKKGVVFEDRVWIEDLKEDGAKVEVMGIHLAPKPTPQPYCKIPRGMRTANPEHGPRISRCFAQAPGCTSF